MVVDWLSRTDLSSVPSPRSRGDTAFDPVEGGTPGIAALFDGMREDRSHAVLDLGAAADSNLCVYSRFARRVRFADLFDEDGSCRGLEGAVPPQPEQPYDLVFAWDILDRIPSEQRPHLVQWLAKISAPDVRLHVLVKATENPTIQPVRFILLDVDRMRREPTGPARPARRSLLPAEVGRLLVPFKVVRAFTLKGGLREYLAVREG